jgi:hypothetical protein
MGVKHNALILAGGMTLLIGYAHVITPLKQIPSTPPSMVKVEATEAGAISSTDPFANSIKRKTLRLTSPSRAPTFSAAPPPPQPRHRPARRMQSRCSC